MNQSDIFSGITAFVRAAQFHSFTRAARSMGITPSAVSKAVARLEAELGTRLFNRSPREVTLTTEGQAFFDRCRELVNSMEDARALVLAPGTEPQGLLRVSAPVTFGAHLLAPALPAFLARYPRLRVELVLTDRVSDLVEERFDVAIRLGEVPDSRLVARPIPSRPYVTTASPGYLQSHGRPKKPGDLKAHNCLGYLLESTGGIRPWIFEHKGQRHTIQPAGSLSTGHAQVLLALAKAGTGIIHTPPYVVKEAIERGELVRLLTQCTGIGQTYHAVYPRNRFGSIRLSAFLEFLGSLDGPPR